MSCEYCVGWNESEYRINTKEFEGRICRTTGKQKQGGDDCCPRFSLHKVFWCVKSACWLDVAVCSARRAKDTEECRRCNQGRKLVELRKFRPTVKPKVILTPLRKKGAGE